MNASAVSVGTRTIINTTSSVTLDPDSVNNTATIETTILVLAADLAASLSGPSSAKVGDPLLIDVGEANDGTGPELNVVVQLWIPAGSSFTSFGSLVGFRPGDGCSN